MTHWHYAALAVFVSLTAAVVSAHPSHVAIAEAEWNQESKKMEVALRVRPEDLEEALTRAETSENIVMGLDYRSISSTPRR